MEIKELNLKNKVALITGGAGSIGSKILSESMLHLAVTKEFTLQIASSY